MNFTGDKNERHIEREWPLSGVPDRIVKNRKILNQTISRFNKWNEDGIPPEQWGVVKAHLDMCKRETEDYEDVLNRMYSFLETHKPKE